MVWASVVPGLLTGRTGQCPTYESRFQTLPRTSRWIDSATSVRRSTTRSERVTWLTLPRLMRPRLTSTYDTFTGGGCAPFPQRFLRIAEAHNFSASVVVIE